MPSSASTQNNYYASHHRRGSQLSLNSTGDQNDTSRPLQLANQSLAFLPPSTYVQPGKGRDRSNSTSTPRSNFQGLPQFDGSNSPIDGSRDSRSFLTQRQYVYPELSNPLQNGSTNLASNSNASQRSHTSQRRGTSFEASKSTPALSTTLRSRTSSIKDLVARFNVEDIPPMPSGPGSRVASREASPIVTSPMLFSTRRNPSRQRGPEGGEGGQHSTVPIKKVRTTSSSQLPSPQQPGRRSVDPLMTNMSSSHVLPASQTSITQRKPLFGEVLPSQTLGLGSPGYGIHAARRRRGSEGSPMHSPNPMFPTNATDFSPTSPDSWYRSAPAATSVPNANGLHSSALSQHRRTRSDLPETQLKRHLPSNSWKPPSNLFESTEMPGSSARRGSQSRIPIIKRPTSSHSGQSPPSSRAPSTLDHYSSSHGIAQGVSQIVGPSTPNRSSSRRKMHTPNSIEAPGRSGQSSAPKHQKSPSLRANIIVPPPKISPPLRSSRTRQTASSASSASTAASRAKMAEKFEIQQRKNSERNAARRQVKPRELNNIDLEARRNNITQALDKLRRSQVIQAVSTQRRNQRLTSAESTEDLTTPDTPAVPDLPEVVINRSFQEEAGEHEKEAAHEQYNPPGSFPEDDTAYHQQDEAQGLRVDVSPSMVNRGFENDQQSDTHLQPSPLDGEEEEPNSAITVETEATVIETEPQAMTRPRSPRPSVLSQIMRMRQTSPLTPASATSGSCSESAADLSDHADEESVHIMLRNTQYTEGSPSLRPTYQEQVSQNHFPDLPPMPGSDRNSWTSSIPDDSSENDRLEAILESSPDPKSKIEASRVERKPHPQSSRDPVDRRNVEVLDSVRSTMASDAYTVVDFVLRRQTEAGHVGGETDDEIVQRVLEHSPQNLYEAFDQTRSEKLAPRELLRDGQGDPERASTRQYVFDENGDSPTIGLAHNNDYQQEDETEIYKEKSPAFDDQSLRPIRHESLTPRQSSQSMHRQDASMDSDRDWDRSYSQMSEQSYVELPASSNQEARDETQEAKYGRMLHSIDTEAGSYSDDESRRGLGLSMRVTSPVSTPWEVESIQRPPSHSPPPLPEVVAQSYEDIETRFAESESYTPPRTVTPRMPPQIPRRVTSQSQMQQHRSRASSGARSMTPSLNTTATSNTAVETVGRPSEELTETEKALSEEKRRLKQRSHVIRELIETEMTFERDMKVVVDIYQATASPIVSKEDIQIIFGNSEHVVQFSKNFGTHLKRAGKPVYSKFRLDGMSVSSAQSGIERSASFTSLPEKENSREPELSDDERDRRTHIGDIFLAYAVNMELIYKEYLIKHDTANEKMQKVLQTPAGKEWTRLCHIESRDLTTAWDLSSLLVKPVQRLLKYPLFLKDLIKSTPDDHPDSKSLRKALDLVTNAITRINEAKKHNERIQEVIGRKRKESDSRTGISKALGRQKERFKQNVGLSELHEDPEYTILYKRFDEHLMFMMVALQDQTEFEKAMNDWVDHLGRIADTAESWCDVQTTRNTVAEAKLRGFCLTAHRVRKVGLPSLLSDVDRLVFEPIRMAHRRMLDFKEDPKGLLQKRDKRVVDYARYKSMKERNEKLDKKSTERMEQWEALNREAKARIAKLVDLSRQVVFLHLLRFNDLYAPWLQLCLRQMAEAMSVDSSDTSQFYLERDFMDEFEPTATALLSLSICNGSLRAEAENMFSVTSPPGLNGGDSPRQPSSTFSANKRSVSINSEGSHQYYPENFKRNSGSFSASPMVASGSSNSLSGLGSSRLRASSATSGQNPRTPEFTTARNMTLPSMGTAGASPQPRPGTSPGLISDNLPAFAPRVSLDAPDPYIGPLRPGSSERPVSSSTFHSAVGMPANAIPSQGSVSSVPTIFSSAMPMSDSPMSTRGPSFEATQSEYNAHSRVLFTAASVYEFNIDAGRSEAGWPYLNYVAGEIFDVLGEKGELWLSKNQDDNHGRIGWIWNKHFAKLEM